MGLNKSLITPHTKSKSLYDSKGGKAEDGGIEQIIHYDHIGGGKVDVTIEHRQDVDALLKLNAERRNTQQGGWDQKAGKMIADIPEIVALTWKHFHGFDLHTANLNDPAQYAQFRRLLDSPEWKYLKTYESPR